MLFWARELETGGWSCRDGRTILDSHVNLDEALAHLAELSHPETPTHFFVHRKTGWIELVEAS